MVILTTMIGLATLVIGRQLFWVFLASLGFVLGFIYGEQYFSNQPQWVILTAGALLALIGALLAYTLQRVAGGIAGFVTGWYLATVILGYLNPGWGQIEQLIPFIVGCLCGLFVWFFFDIGIIVLSSFFGAAVILSGINLRGQMEMIFLVMFAVLGMAIQGILYSQEIAKRGR